MVRGRAPCRGRPAQAEGITQEMPPRRRSALPLSLTITSYFRRPRSVRFVVREPLRFLQLVRIRFQHQFPLLSFFVPRIALNGTATSLSLSPTIRACICPASLISTSLIEPIFLLFESDVLLVVIRNRKRFAQNRAQGLFVSRRRLLSCSNPGQEQQDGGSGINHLPAGQAVNVGTAGRIPAHKPELRLEDETFRRARSDLGCGSCATPELRGPPVLGQTARCLYNSGLACAAPAIL